MSNEQNEVVEALMTRIEALQIKNEALLVKIEALELMNSNLEFLREVKNTMPPSPAIYMNGSSAQRSSAPSVTSANEDEDYDNEDEDEDEDEAQPTAKKRGRKPKPSASQIAKLQVPLEKSLRDMLSGERYNRATFRALTGIMLCLFENKTATVTMLHEYIGGARVTVVRHTGLLKRMGLLRYEGSRKRGHYAMTDKGRALFNELRSEHGA